MKKSLAVIAAATLLLSACSSPSEDKSTEAVETTTAGEEISQEPTPTDPPPIKALDSMQPMPEGGATDAEMGAVHDRSLVLAQEVVATQRDAANVWFSPAGVQMALAIAGSGASGDVDKELSEFIGSTPEVRDAAIGKTINYALFTASRGIHMNAVLAENSTANLPMDTEVVEATAKKWGAQHVVGNTDEVNAELETWVAAATMGRIRDLPETVTDQTPLTIMTALMADGDWAKACDSSTMPFNLETGSERVPAVHCTGETVSTVTNGVRVEMHTANGLRVDFFLPNEGIDPADLTAKDFSEEGTPRLRDVRFPKLSLDSSLTLSEVLTELGMPDLKDSLTGFTTDGTAVPLNLIYQRAILELDENGFQATAVTQMMGVTSVKDDPTGEIIEIDRPYAIRISDSQGWTLFYGTVKDPRED